MTIWNVLILLCLPDKFQALTTKNLNYKGVMATQAWWDLAKFEETSLVSPTPSTCASLCNRRAECRYFTLHGGHLCQLGKSLTCSTDATLGTDLLVYTLPKTYQTDPAEVCPLTPSVVDETYLSDKFKAANGYIFVDGCEVGWAEPNFWNGPTGAIGEDDSYIVLDLGCCMLVSKATIKNSHNYSGYVRFVKYVVDAYSSFGGGLKFIKIE